MSTSMHQYNAQTATTVKLTGAVAIHPETMQAHLHMTDVVRFRAQAKHMYAPSTDQ
jgi:hypothetical protein